MIELQSVTVESICVNRPMIRQYGNLFQLLILREKNKQGCGHFMFKGRGFTLNILHEFCSQGSLTNIEDHTTFVSNKNLKSLRFITPEFLYDLNQIIVKSANALVEWADEKSPKNT